MSRQDIAEGLQTAGHVFDVSGIGSAFSMVCSPFAPSIGLVGLAVDTLMDGEKSGLNKTLSIGVPYRVGKLGVKVVTNPAISKAASEAYGLGVYKLTGVIIDAKYDCRKSKGCNKFCDNMYKDRRWL